MTGPEFAFEVRPQVLAGYAETLRACAADLASAGEAVAALRVERHWFGKLPPAGFLADRYGAHQREVLAEAGALATWLTAATAGLTECAQRYSAADRVVAGAAEAVDAALRVGIETPDPPRATFSGPPQDADRPEAAAPADDAARG